MASAFRRTTSASLSEEVTPSCGDKRYRHGLTAQHLLGSGILPSETRPLRYDYCVLKPCHQPCSVAQGKVEGGTQVAHRRTNFSSQLSIFKLFAVADTLTL